MTKKRSSAILIAILLAGMLASAHSTHAAPHAPQQVPGEVLVKFKNVVSQEERASELARHRAKAKSQIAGLDVVVAEVGRGLEGNVVSGLLSSGKVAFAEPNYIARAVAVPNDPHFASKQWGLENTGQIINGATGQVDADIDGPTGWDTSTGTGVKVAILDTGVDQDHEDLTGKLGLQANFTSSPTIDDFYGHGTHVAGTVFAKTNNGLGVAGGCPDCTGLNGKVLDDQGNGAYSGVASGIVWAADNGAKVINLSLGGAGASSTLENAVNYAWSKGAVVVAAAGNNGTSAKFYPAAYARAIAVAALDNQDRKPPFSNYGAQWVDVAAPGMAIYSTTPNHAFALETSGYSRNYDYLSGTSMAAPMASSVAALVWSSPYGTSNTAVRSRMENTADKISGAKRFWAYGRVNAANALR